MGDPKAVERMARFGIQSSNSFGVSVPKLRTLAREVGRDHLLALKLWETGLPDSRLLAWQPFMIAGASDKRNRVRKAFNWSRRQLGKRNLKLNRGGVCTALKIQKNQSGAAKWVASAALRELNSPQVMKRLRENKYR